MSEQNQQINQKATGRNAVAEKRRVVIKGAGVVTPIGLDLATFWNNLLQGVVGIQPLKLAGMERGRVHLAAQIPSFDPLQVMDRKDARRMDRYCQFAVAAAAEAIQNSRIDLNSHDPWKTGVIIGSGVGGLETMATEYRKLYLEGGRTRFAAVHPDDDRQYGSRPDINDLSGQGEQPVCDHCLRIRDTCNRRSISICTVRTAGCLHCRRC